MFSRASARMMAELLREFETAPSKRPHVKFVAPPRRQPRLFRGAGLDAYESSQPSASGRLLLLPSLGDCGPRDSFKGSVNGNDHGHGEDDDDLDRGHSGQKVQGVDLRPPDDRLGSETCPPADIRRVGIGVMRAVDVRRPRADGDDLTDHACG